MSLRKIFFALCLIAAFIVMLSVAVSAEEIRVYDMDDMLTSAEEENITKAALDAEAESGCRFYTVTHAADGRFEKYIGEDFIEDHGLSYNDDILLLIITYDKVEGVYYYNMYYYGMPSRRISDIEVDSILDDGRVYDKLKTGRLESGILAFIELSAEATKMPLGVLVVIAVIAAVVVCAITVSLITAKYKMKRNPTNYPLDRYAKLALTDSDDKFINKNVVFVYTSSGNGSGGRVGGGGGFGGGRGHAGGR